MVFIEWSRQLSFTVSEFPLYCFLKLNFIPSPYSYDSMHAIPENPAPMTMLGKVGCLSKTGLQSGVSYKIFTTH